MDTAKPAATKSRTALVSASGGDLAGVKFSGSTYWSAADPGTWFGVNRETMGLRRWVETSGETGAAMRKIDYPDPERNIQKYMQHLGMEPTREAFLAAIRAQSRRHWRKEFTAAAINDWMRAGFGAKKVPAGEQPAKEPPRRLQSPAEYH